MGAGRVVGQHYWALLLQFWWLLHYFLNRVRSLIRKGRLLRDGTALHLLIALVYELLCLMREVAASDWIRLQRVHLLDAHYLLLDHLVLVESMLDLLRVARREVELFGLG